ncbi:threonine deaminase [Coemansia spiralis]|uniref:Threonine dehydratase n=2 Tax=Coemansia TaxID=4863 RepID=A0A9W8G6Q8_9FUNG|nr:threonine dehydratase-like protein [Coemansia spiralis]KAJ1995523.1 threonine deaminase [Coemansia umbellata]KAJ2625144.1 threonine deaminase [Coemansia sp. RSA 1358]KAJ2679902.1 threonine deaminase [Coemansia spiralis]
MDQQFSSLSVTSGNNSGTSTGISTPTAVPDTLPNSRTINEYAGMQTLLESGLSTPVDGSNTRIPSDAVIAGVGQKLGATKEQEPDYLQMILNSYVYDVSTETPLTHAVNLSSRCGNSVFLKRDDLQPVFSFKIRGAYNRISHLTEEEKARGIIACSAGNHAQGVAMSAKHLGIKATIVMPLLTPAIKWQNVKRLGAEVVLHGAGFDEAKLECSRLEKLHGLTNIPPFDDPYVIAGQGTVAMEILRQRKAVDIDAIFVPVGGGGLISGIAAYVKRVSPSVKVIGVETIDSCAMAQSLKAGKRLILPEVGLFADGTAVCQVGKECFRLASKYVDDVVLVTNDEVCAAIKDVFEDTRSVLEPSGALGTAGLKKYARIHGLKGNSLVAITSGANMNFDRLRFVAERAAMGEQKEVLMSVVIPERAGSYIKLHDIIYPRAITEFTYRYGHPEKAHIFMSFEVKDRAREVPAIIEKLKAQSMVATDLTDNELAKSHARYIVGGRSSVPNEYMIRFEFPERHGALKKFLGGLQFDWNISLFQYRNFGQDVAKVLVGIQVPTSNEEAASLQPGEIPKSLQRFLADLDYRYVNETDNPVFQQFMRY